MGTNLHWIGTSISSGRSNTGFGGFLTTLSPVGPAYPQAGTVLSYACSGNDVFGENSEYLDAFNTSYVGAYTRWNQIANGTGGSNWTKADTNEIPCWLPYGYCFPGSVNEFPTLSWEYGGQSGTYTWGNTWNVSYSDGAGGTLYESGVYEYHGTGYLLGPAGYWADGNVYYVSQGQWAWWYNYGYYLGTYWGTAYNDVGCGDFAVYSYEYYSYADGTGGTFNNYSGNYQYPSNGTYLHNCGDYNYYANGNGGYYSEFTGGGGGNEYPSYGTWLNSGSGTYYVNVGCGEWSVGDYNWTQYADGMGGSYYESSDSYVGDGVYLGSCNGYEYYSDGSGSYYTEGGGPSYPEYGTFLGGNDNPIYVNVGCGDWQIGTSYSNDYADGNGGSYNESGSDYYSFGTYLGNCNGMDYYAEYNGSYYTQGEPPPPPCPEYGTFAYDAEDTQVEVPFGSGNYFFDGNDNRYLNDGNCGVFFFYDGLYSYGTYITTYDGTDYYWDGAGGYYS